jgi:hypothetical protein
MNSQAKIYNPTPVPPRSHHYNPRVYLRQFVNPASRKELWEYDLGQGTVKQSAPKKSGCEDYYHSFELPGGVRDDESIERSCSDIENRLPKLVEVVRNNQPVSEFVWGTLFSFADLQRARCPKALHSIQKFLSDVKTRVFELWQHSHDFDEAMAKIGKNPDEVRSDHFDIAADHGHTVLLTLSAFDSGNLASLFGRMKWAFLVAPPDRSFSTSDAPVCCWAPPDNRGAFGAVGPSNADVEITFPLSRRVCGFGNWGGTPLQLYHDLPADNTDVVNYRTVRNGWKFIYGPINDARILRLVAEVADFRNGNDEATS